jgi:hypothetical protein
MDFDTKSQHEIDSRQLVMEESDSCNLASPSVAAIVPGTVNSLRHRLEVQTSSCTTSRALSSKDSRDIKIHAECSTSMGVRNLGRTRSDTSQPSSTHTRVVRHNDRYGNMNLSVQLSDSSRESSNSGSQYLSVKSDGQSSLSTPTPVVASTPLSQCMIQQESR